MSTALFLIGGLVMGLGFAIRPVRTEIQFTLESAPVLRTQDNELDVVRRESTGFTSVVTYWVRDGKIESKPMSDKVKSFTQ